MCRGNRASMLSASGKENENTLLPVLRLSRGGNPSRLCYQCFKDFPLRMGPMIEGLKDRLRSVTASCISGVRMICGKQCPTTPPPTCTLAGRCRSETCCL